MQDDSDPRDSSLKLFVHGFAGKVLATVVSATLISTVGLMFSLTSDVRVISVQMKFLTEQMQQIKHESKTWRNELDSRITRIEERK